MSLQSDLATLRNLGTEDAMTMHLDTPTNLSSAVRRKECAGNRYDGIERYAIEMVRFNAGQLVGTRGLCVSDRHAIEQDLMLDLIRRLPKYDPKRGQFKTFVSRVVDHRAPGSDTAAARSRGSWSPPGRDFETILVLKGDSPLEFRRNDKLRAVAYASNGALLDALVGKDSSWKTLEIFRSDSIRDLTLGQLEFSIQHGGARGKRPENHGTYNFERPPWHWTSILGRTLPRGDSRENK